MKVLLLEIRKQRRTGIFPLFWAAGLFAGLYGAVYFMLRKLTVLQFGMNVLDVLLSQVYGVICVINMFLLILAAVMLWHCEFAAEAIKKMAVLPIRKESLFLGKFILAAAAFAGTVCIEFSCIWLTGLAFLPAEAVNAAAVLQYACMAWASSLGVLSCMLFISSRTGNMWISLGTGVIGFLSGMSLVNLPSWICLLDPFVVMFKPVLAYNATADPSIVLASIVQSVFFLGAGCILAAHPVLD